MSEPNLFRRIQCKLNLCAGYMDHEKIDGVWMIGLRCTATGKLHSPIRSKYQDNERYENPRIKPPPNETKE